MHTLYENETMFMTNRTRYIVLCENNGFCLWFPFPSFGVSWFDSGWINYVIKENNSAHRLVTSD